MLIATLQKFLEEYYGKKLDVRLIHSISHSLNHRLNLRSVVHSVKVKILNARYAAVKAGLSC
jgi:hypothetical protein